MASRRVVRWAPCLPAPLAHGPGREGRLIALRAVPLVAGGSSAFVAAFRQVLGRTPGKYFAAAPG